MQFLVSTPEAMAIGTWEDESYAQAFMKTGVFKELVESLESYLDGDPRAKVWNLLYFKQAT
jgi:quinol monooxygenase YgiN